jgi:hypothetical protein
MIMLEAGERRGERSSRASTSKQRRLMGWMGQFTFDQRTLYAIRSRAPIVAPLAIVAIVNAMIGLSLRPLFLETLSGESQGVASFVTYVFWLTIFSSPVIVLAKAFLLAVVGWSIAALLGEAARLRTLVSTLLFGEVLFLIPGVLDLVVLYLRRLSGIMSAADLVVRWGLDLIVETSSPVLSAVLQGTSVFHLIWVAFLNAAFARGVGLSRAGAFVTTVGVWIALVASDVIRLSVLS